MWKRGALIIGLYLAAVMRPIFVAAQEPGLFMEATESAAASASAMEATPSGIVELVTEKKADLTETRGEVKSKLERYLDERPVGQLKLGTVLQHAIRNAVDQGVPPNTIVLVPLFPAVAAMIAASRHLLGLRGFGIFTPAVLSVAFLATGVLVGILLFVIILLVATVGRMSLRSLHLQYLPRMALLLWFVSLGVFAALFGAPYLNLAAMVEISIFPILILILLAETFIEVQMGKSQREAMELTIETIILALICSLVMSLDVVQRFALLNPEWLVVGVAVFDVFMGRYVGLRFLEYLKFKKLLG